MVGCFLKKALTWRSGWGKCIFYQNIIYVFLWNVFSNFFINDISKVMLICEYLVNIHEVHLILYKQ